MRNTPLIVTIFGAESTGKTTLSRQLAESLGGEWVEEFARPYLETTGEAITTRSMCAIWQGQKALQEAVRTSPKPFVLQDTDLFSTVGYWRLPHVTSTIGACPDELADDAACLASHLYLVVQSNIPFEPDRLRYGGDKRESPDAYWISLCEHYGLPYVVLEASDKKQRLTEAIRCIKERSLLCAAS